MKKALVILMLIIATNTNASWLEKDDINHLSISFGLGLMSNQILPDSMSPFERIAYGAIIGTIPGLLKEILDINHLNKPGFSRRDLLMDVLGSVAGSFVGEKVRIYVKTDPVNQVFIAYSSKF